MFSVYVSVPSGFDKCPTSPVSCVITVGWQKDELHLPALSYTHSLYTQRNFSQASLTATCTCSVAKTHSENPALPSTLIYQLIPKGVWAESNDPLWRPSHSAPIDFHRDAKQAEGQRGAPQSAIHKVLALLWHRQVRTVSHILAYSDQVCGLKTLQTFPTYSKVSSLWLHLLRILFSIAVSLWLILNIFNLHHPLSFTLHKILFGSGIHVYSLSSPLNP